MLGLISARDTTCMSRTSQYFYKKKNDVRCIGRMKPQLDMGFNIRCQHQGSLGLLMLTPKKEKSLHISLNRELAFYGSHYRCRHCSRHCRLDTVVDTVTIVDTVVVVNIVVEVV